MPVPTFRECVPQLGELLRRQRGMAAVLIDLSALGPIERTFGPAAHQSVRAQVEPVLAEMRQTVRERDLLTRHEAAGDRFLLFLSGPRDTSHPFAFADLHRLASRLEEYLTPRIARLTLPYLRDRPSVEVGYAFVIQSPLEHEERQVLRLIDDCFASSELRRRLRDRDDRERVMEVIYNGNVWTAFQKINEISTGQVMGHEALSRGPRGTALQSPLALFGLAGRYGMAEELERACRRQTFTDWAAFGAPTRLFLNTVPATVRDPSFLGLGVLEYLGNVPPRMVTLEITERQVIENLGLYREAMHSFQELGFTFAIDDLGAGYSGLETLATLGAAYLKIDMGLVREVHEKRVSQQVIKAIVDMAAGVGSTVIAEGIETQEEADAIISLGVRFGQGYLWGRPLEPPSAPPPPAAKATQSP